MQTGEDIQGLRKIMDMTRLLSLAILAIHFYSSCYAAFKDWALTQSLIDRVVLTFGKTALFRSGLTTKACVLLLLAVSYWVLKAVRMKSSVKIPSSFI